MKFIKYLVLLLTISCTVANALEFLWPYDTDDFLNTSVLTTFGQYQRAYVGGGYNSTISYYHDGIDILPPENADARVRHMITGYITESHCMDEEDGCVVKVCSSRFSCFMINEDEIPYCIVYGHLDISSDLDSYSSGKEVEAGDFIAETIHPDIPHVHITVLSAEEAESGGCGETPVNPLEYLPAISDDQPPSITQINFMHILKKDIIVLANPIVYGDIDIIATAYDINSSDSAKRLGLYELSYSIYDNKDNQVDEPKYLFRFETNLPYYDLWKSDGNIYDVESNRVFDIYQRFFYPNSFNGPFSFTVTNTDGKTIPGAKSSSPNYSLENWSSLKPDEVWRTKLHKDSPDTGVIRKAETNEEAEYPDGVYYVSVCAKDHAGNENDVYCKSEKKRVVVDNYVPYIKKVKITDADNSTDYYNAEWKYNRPLMNLEKQIPSRMTGEVNLNIEITMSEELRIDTDIWAITPLLRICKGWPIANSTSCERYKEDHVLEQDGADTNIFRATDINIKDPGVFFIQISNVADQGGNRLDAFPVTVSRRDEEAPATWINADTGAGSVDRNHIFYLWPSGRNEIPANESRTMAPPIQNESSGGFGVLAGYADFKSVTVQGVTAGNNNVITTADHGVMYVSRSLETDMVAQSMFRGIINFPDPTTAILIPDNTVTPNHNPPDWTTSRNGYVFIYRGLFPTAENFFCNQYQNGVTSGNRTYTVEAGDYIAPVDRLESGKDQRYPDYIRLEAYRLQGFTQNDVESLATAITGDYESLRQTANINPLLAINALSSTEYDPGGNPPIIHEICLNASTGYSVDDYKCTAPGGTIDISGADEEKTYGITVTADDYMNSLFNDESIINDINPVRQDGNQHARFVAPGVYKVKYTIKDSNSTILQSGGLIFISGFTQRNLDFTHYIKRRDTGAEPYQINNYAVSYSLPVFGREATDDDLMNVGGDVTSGMIEQSPKFRPINTPGTKITISVTVCDAVNSENNTSSCTKSEITVKKTDRVAPKPPSFDNNAGKTAQRITQNAVLVSWNPPAEDADGAPLPEGETIYYYVYRKPSSQTDDQYVRITSELISDVFYVDREIDAATAYEYAVTAVRKLIIGSNNPANTYYFESGMLTAVASAIEFKKLGDGSVAQKGWNLISEPYDLRPSSADYPQLYYDVDLIFDIGLDAQSAARVQAIPDSNLPSGERQHMSFCYETNCPAIGNLTSTRIDKPRPGIAYWVFTDNPDGIEQITENAIGSNKSYQIQLHTGWNMIANPYTNLTGFAWDDDHIKIYQSANGEAVLKSIAEAISAGWIGGSPYKWEEAETPYDAGAGFTDEYIRIKVITGNLFYRYSASDVFKSDWTELETGDNILATSYSWGVGSNIFTSSAIEFVLGAARDDVKSLSEAVSNSWIDEIVNYGHTYTHLENSAIMEKWKGYFLRAKDQGIFLVLTNPDSWSNVYADSAINSSDIQSGLLVDSIVTPRSLAKIKPLIGPSRSVARLSVTDQIERTEVRKSVGEVFNMDLYVEAGEFTMGAFTLDYDETVLAPCVRNAQTPSDPTKCVEVAPGESYPLNSVPSQTNLSAVVGGSIHFEIAYMSGGPHDRVKLGTVTFKVKKSGASDITFKPEEDALAVYGVVDGRLTNDFDVEVSPARFVEKSYVDYSPPSISIKNILPAAPDTYIAPGAAPPHDGVSVDYDVTDNSADNVDVKIKVIDIDTGEPVD